jgi:hypothetical protein
MKKYADMHRQEQQLEVNQQVYLRLQPYRQISVSAHRDLKLAPSFYGPFTVVRKVGSVAYELDLPPESCIHSDFHVSQLKLKLGTHASPLPKLASVDLHGVIQPEPLAVLNQRSKKSNNCAVVELLIQWAGQPANDATWEEYHSLKCANPHLMGKVF